MDLYEKIEFDTSFPFDIYVGSGIPWTPEIEKKPYLHKHDCLELNYVLEGEGYNCFCAEKCKLVPGDLYLINNQEYHFAINKKNLRMIIIVFDANLVWENNTFDYLYLKTFFCWGNPSVRRVRGDWEHSVKAVQVIHQIENEWKDKRVGYELMIKSLLLELLTLIFRFASESTELKTEAHIFEKNYSKLKPALEYIALHFSEDMKLEDLAKMSYLSPHYFSTIFKETTRTSLSAYIQKVRINHACQLLKTTKLDIAHIAAECGFNSVSYFNKIFRSWIDCTPLEYRNDLTVKRSAINNHMEEQ